MRMSTLLNEVRNFELDEGFSPKEIKMAIGIASDPRYAKGNMTGAVTAIERMKKGLSKHPQVMAVLKRQNENLDEAKYEVNFSKWDLSLGLLKPYNVHTRPGLSNQFLPILPDTWIYDDVVFGWPNIVKSESLSMSIPPSIMFEARHISTG